MYEQVKKPKESKSNAVATSVVQKKSDVKQGFGLVDNRLFRPLRNGVIQCGGGASKPMEEPSKVAVKTELRPFNIPTELTKEYEIYTGEFNANSMKLDKKSNWKAPKPLSMRDWAAATPRWGHVWQ